MDWKGLFWQIIQGYKRLLILTAWLILGAGFVWGVVSVIMIASGKIQFSWWYLPCWILVLTGIAGAVGTYE